jgi:N-acetylmuramoyl-L-alanine amidase
VETSVTPLKQETKAPDPIVNAPEPILKKIIPEPPPTNQVPNVVINQVPIELPAPKLTNLWVSWAGWSQTNGLGKPLPLSSTANPTYLLQTPTGAMSLSVGSRLAHFGKSEWQLGFAPQLINGEPYIHALDVEKNIQPLLNGISDIVITKRIVVLDPGHGGEDPGTKSVIGNHFEKDYTLDWARRLRPLLETQGWKVYLTRTNDVRLSLNDRVDFADRVGAILFISLHFNSAFPNLRQSGLETYCLTPSGMPSNLIRNFPDDSKEVFPNNAFDLQNVELAMRLHRSVLESTKRPDRGVRRARFMGVLRGHQRPAVLIEGGYLSNPQEARLIADPAFRQKLAESIANALNQVTVKEPWGPDEE